MKINEYIRKFLQLSCHCAVLVVVCSCTVGPNYKRPDVANITPNDWRWKIAEPKDTIPKGEWWKIFNDPALNELETGAVADNQNLQAAVARVDQARAAARISRSRFFPELSLDPLIKRERTSANQPIPIPIPPQFTLSSMHLNTFSVPLDLSYEVDLWGRVRRSFEAAQARAEGSSSDYQNVLLTLTGDVAVNYFLIRSLDSEIATLRQTVRLRSESVRILNDRFETGSISEIDLDRAKTELTIAEADLTDTTRQRAETLNALALLCGKPASSFEIAERPMAASPPHAPAGLPSSLLERRPDIAAAERNLAEKNAQIGVAVAGYFPVLRLTGQAGYLSDKADALFSEDSWVWSIGPNVTLPLFNGGRTAADVKQAEAVYREALADYRQTILTAFKDVEDSLAQVVLRDEQAVAQAKAVTSARRVAELVNARYTAGAISHLEVADAEREMLQQERRETELTGQRFAASVRLIKSLGGGW
jgi:multidrug efflux system outer membrane protein